MKTKILIVTLATVCLSACSKTNFNTTPTLEFKSTNSDVYHRGDIIEFVIKYTDKEGDIQNDIYLEEVTKDKDCPKNNDFRSHEPIPSGVPQKTDAEGEIVIKYYYGIIDPNNGTIPTFGGPQCQRNDTCYFKFALTDKANNTSDTITSPQIVFVY